ncbi:MAG: serine hydrolase domain-containing protein, partial [Bacteroidota bacterium]
MRKQALVFLLLLAAYTEVPGQPTKPLGYKETIERARRFVSDSLRVHNIPGASVSVSVNGAVIWSEGFGYADLEQKVPVSNETKFRIGSISKPLTAAGLGVLYDEGRINLDTLIQAYVPGFPLKSHPITLRHLAGHIAGIRHYRGAEMLLSRRFLTVEEGLEIFKDDTLLFAPGTRFSYSSYAWNLISAAIERASGEDFIRFMSKRVITPLGMTNTVADFSDSLISWRARWYTEDSLGHTINAPFVDNSYKWAGGGFLSTTEDLLKFGNAMLSNALLKPETAAMMFTSQKLNDGRETRYGIGWFSRKDSKGRTVITHSGGSMGGTANLL